MSARTLAEQALKAISDHLAQGDWGNAERVLNAYAADFARTEEIVTDAHGGPSCIGTQGAAA